MYIAYDHINIFIILTVHSARLTPFSLSLSHSILPIFLFFHISIHFIYLILSTLSIYLPYLSIYPSIYLSIYLILSTLSIYLSIYLSICSNSDTIILIEFLLKSQFPSLADQYEKLVSAHRNNRYSIDRSYRI